MNVAKNDKCQKLFLTFKIDLKVLLLDELCTLIFMYFSLLQTIADIPHRNTVFVTMFFSKMFVVQKLMTETVSYKSQVTVNTPNKSECRVALGVDFVFGTHEIFTSATRGHHVTPFQRLIVTGSAESEPQITIEQILSIKGHNRTYYMVFHFCNNSTPIFTICFFSSPADLFASLPSCVTCESQHIRSLAQTQHRQQLYEPSDL